MLPLLAGIAAGVFVFAWAGHRGGGLSRLVVAGDAFVDVTRSPDCLQVETNSGGYDGQFYFRLAVSPLSRSPVLAGVRFDYPVYRAQRIFYPALAHVLALGSDCAVLWSLPMVNVLSIMLLVWIGARFLAAPEISPLSAIALALWPGFLFSLARDLTEPLASALLILGLIAAAREAWFPATLLLSLAALTRETTLIAAVIVFGYGVIRTFRQRRVSALLVVGSIPPLVHLAWKRWLFWSWDLPVNWGLGKQSEMPFAAFLRLLRDSWHAGTHAGRVQVIELIAFALFSAIVILSVRHATVPRLVKACAIAYLLFAFSLSGEIWLEDWAFLRATAEYGALGAAVVMTARPAWRHIGTALLLAGTLVLSYDMLVFR